MDQSTSEGRYGHFTAKFLREAHLEVAPLVVTNLVESIQWDIVRCKRGQVRIYSFEQMALWPNMNDFIVTIHIFALKNA